MSSLDATLLHLFEKHRIVFWYDETGESRGKLDELELQDVETIIIEHNEFSVKYRLLITEPAKKFLVYTPTARPEDHENWLLDLLLANKEFNANRASLILTELGLPETVSTIVNEHVDFFNKERSRSLQKRLSGTIDVNTLQRHMIGVICREPDSGTEALLFRLFEADAKNRIEVWGLIEKMKLEGFWWECIDEQYGYSSANPTLHDFILELFKQSYTGKSTLKEQKHHDALLMLKRWKDSTTFRKTFEWFSDRAAEELGYGNKTPSSIDTLRDQDDFRFIEEWIVNYLAQGIVDQTLQPDTVRDWIEDRKTSYWFNGYASVYGALEHANKLRHIIQSATWNYETVDDALAYYTKTGYKGDYHYRKFMYEYDHDNRIAGLGECAKKMENFYINKFQNPLNKAWMKFVENKSFLHQEKIIRQQDFFNTIVRPFCEKETAVFVVVSDALRYESGKELCKRLIQTDKNDVSIQPMLSVLPSYTKAGMAGLLPHKELSCDIEADTIMADGNSTSGTAARSAILEKELKGKATAVTFDEFRQLTANKESGREWVKKYSVVYIYHNTIDKTGDDKMSERRVFDATEEAFRDIIDIVKTVHNMNRSHVIITADHGYLYQHAELHESDFVDADLPDGIVRKNRRFVFGASLPESPGMHRFTLKELGFKGKGHCLIPKGVMRLRQQGSGARYVHGGASLQELVVPVLHFTRKRDTTVEMVDISVMGLNQKITTNIVPVKFYQNSPVGDRVLPRTITAGIYGEDGTLLSDTVELTFDSESTESTDREKKYTFSLSSEISRYNGKDVILRLRERIGNTNQMNTYMESRHQLFITFANDF